MSYKSRICALIAALSVLAAFLAVLSLPATLSHYGLTNDSGWSTLGKRSLASVNATGFVTVWYAEVPNYSYMASFGDVDGFAGDEAIVTNGHVVTVISRSKMLFNGTVATSGHISDVVYIPQEKLFAIVVTEYGVGTSVLVFDVSRGVFNELFHVRGEYYNLYTLDIDGDDSVEYLLTGYDNVTLVKDGKELYTRRIGSESIAVGVFTAGTPSLAFLRDGVLYVIDLRSFSGIAEYNIGVEYGGLYPGDIDGDGVDEIYISYNNKLALLDDGSIKTVLRLSDGANIYAVKVYGSDLVVLYSWYASGIYGTNLLVTTAQGDVRVNKSLGDVWLFSVVAQDINGDGVVDPAVLVNGNLTVFDGSNGNELYRAEVAGEGGQVEEGSVYIADINGDGYGEFVTLAGNRVVSIAPVMLRIESIALESVDPSTGSATVSIGARVVGTDSINVAFKLRVLDPQGNVYFEDSWSEVLTSGTSYIERNVSVPIGEEFKIVCTASFEGARHSEYVENEFGAIEVHKVRFQVVIPETAYVGESFPITIIVSNPSDSELRYFVEIVVHGPSTTVYTKDVVVEPKTNKTDTVYITLNDEGTYSLEVTVLSKGKEIFHGSYEVVARTKTIGETIVSDVTKPTALVAAGSVAAASAIVTNVVVSRAASAPLQASMTNLLSGRRVRFRKRIVRYSVVFAEPSVTKVTLTSSAKILIESSEGIEPEVKIVSTPKRVVASPMDEGGKRYILLEGRGKGTLKVTVCTPINCRKFKIGVTYPSRVRKPSSIGNLEVVGKLAKDTYLVKSEDGKLYTATKLREKKEVEYPRYTKVLETYASGGYLIKEFVNGETLKEYTRKLHGMNIVRALSLVDEIFSFYLKALRDGVKLPLSPTAIVLTPDGNFVIDPTTEENYLEEYSEEGLVAASAKLLYTAITGKKPDKISKFMDKVKQKAIAAAAREAVKRGVSLVLPISLEIDLDFVSMPAELKELIMYSLAPKERRLTPEEFRNYLNHLLEILKIKGVKSVRTPKTQ